MPSTNYPWQSYFLKIAGFYLENNANEMKICPYRLEEKKFLFGGSLEVKEAVDQEFAWMTGNLNWIRNHSIKNLSELLPKKIQKF